MTKINGLISIKSSSEMDSWKDRDSQGLKPKTEKETLLYFVLETTSLFCLLHCFAVCENFAN